MLELIERQITALTASPEATVTGFALAASLAVFVAVIAAALFVSALGDPTRRRLRSVTAAEVRTDDTGAAVRSAEAVGDYLMPKDEKERGRIHDMLIHAGIRSPNAMRIFFGTKLLLILGLTATAFAATLSLKALPLTTTILSVVSAAIIGYLGPTWWLNRAVRIRQQAVRRGLPDMLDLVVVCTEAGLGLGAAIHRVAVDIEVGHPELADELKTFSLQTQAGLDHRTALRDFEQRTGVEEVRGLVSTLLQSMTLGTSVAETLRIFADELRDKRMQAAEEKAAMVSTKMLFPLVFFLLPGFMLVAIGPPLLGAMRAMQGIG
jgi:tight adherence protein C